MERVKCVKLGDLTSWFELYEKLEELEKRMLEDIKRLQRLMPSEGERKTEFGAAIYQQVMQKIAQKEEQLKRIQKNRLKLEWLAIAKIKSNQWPLNVFREYEFAKNLVELARIRRQQALEICRNCKECNEIIKVRKNNRVIPLSAVVGTTRGIPFEETCRLVMLFDVRGEYRIVRKTVSRERLDYYCKQFPSWKTLLHWYIESERIPLDESIVVDTLKHGCHRACMRFPLIDPSSDNSDSDPRAPDHFPEDVAWEVSPEGEVTRVLHAPEHGSDEYEA